MRYIYSILLLLSYAPYTSALSIDAQVNKTRIARNEQLRLTVTIELEQMDALQPQLPSMAAFDVYKAGHRRNYQFINGQVSSKVVHIYLLSPRTVGNAVIPPIHVTHKGESAKTAPISIRVLPDNTPTPTGATPPSAQRQPAPASQNRAQDAPDMFLTAELDNKHPFVNEQVLMTVLFYLGVQPLGEARYELPDTHGFTRETLETHSPVHSVEKNGRTYYLHQIKTALFPIKAGKLPIGETKIAIRVQGGADPFANDFMSRFFFQPSSILKTVKSNPLLVQARPLPEKGRPSHFSGGVGRFRLLASAEPKSVKVGEAITLSVSVEGRGNINMLGSIELPQMDNFRVYETVSSVDSRTDDRGVHGSKVYKTVLVPRVSGDLKIPPIPFSYFDPKKEEYVALQTPSIHIPVEAGDPTAAPVGFQASGNGGKITRVTADIRHIRAAVRPAPMRRAAAAFAGALAVHMIPSVIFIACAGISFNKQRLLRDPKRRRFREARARARERIGHRKTPAKSSAQLADALTHYLADKLGVAPAGLTQKEVRAQLAEKFPAIPEGHYHQIKLLWEELEVMRFAPSNGENSEASEKIKKDILDLINALEEAIG